MRRDLVINVEADTGKTAQELEKAKRAANAYERELRKLERQQAKVDAAMTKVGRGMLVAGAAIAAGLGLAVKAAIDWESSWAGVLKTVDGTDEQMAALEKEIRGLTAVLPATHAEIAAVAEAAGQLGIQRENVAGFTRVMIDMGESTNLAATDAATALARMMNIMQTAPGDVDRLGSTIVDLGNSSATTEAEIVAMALRIAGAGNQIGLSEADVLSYAAALSSVGIAAESGGTAVSKVFLEIDSAVRSGGEELEVFARTAGMTSEEFVRAYQQDAAGAIAAFITGLGRIQAEGGDVNAVLSQIGLTEIRVADALRRTAGAGDLITKSLATGNQAWQANNALTEEAARRYATTEAQMAMARNQVNDFAIDMGQTLLPVVADTATGVGTLAGIVGDLPGPVKTALAMLAALTAGLLLTSGATLVLIPRIHALRTAMTTMSISMRTLSLSAGGIGLALTVVATAFAIFSARAAESKQQIKDLAAEVDLSTRSLSENGQAMRARNLLADDDVRWMLKRGLAEKDLIDAIQGSDEAFQRGMEWAEGRGGTIQEKRFQRIVREQRALEAKAVAEAEATAALTGGTAATEVAADAAAELDGQAASLAQTFGVGADQAVEMATGVEDLDKALRDLLDTAFSVEEAEDDVIRAMQRMTEEAKENGAAIEGNSEAALANRDNVRDLIRSHVDLISTMAEGGASADELTTETEKLRRKFVDTMRQLGFSEEAIEDYASSYDLIPSIVSTLIRTPGLTAAERNARNLKFSLDRIPRRVDIDIHQSITAPVGSQRVGFQHGGEVHGPEGADRVPAMLTAQEFVVRRPVAQANRAALAALNATGRWPARPGEEFVHVHRYEFATRGTELDRLIQQSVERGMRTSSSFRTAVRGSSQH
jgi:TP901 family phage tail tape measure protein